MEKVKSAAFTGGVMSAVADKLREARALIEKGWTRGDNCRDGRAKAADGSSVRSLAREYGVSHQPIHDIITRKTWAKADAQ